MSDFTVFFERHVLFFNLDSDAIVSQVLDELGLQLTDQLSGLPQASGSIAASGVAAKTPAALAAGGGGGGGGASSPLSAADADLQARLDNLRRE